MYCQGCWQGRTINTRSVCFSYLIIDTPIPLNIGTAKKLLRNVGVTFQHSEDLGQKTPDIHNTYFFSWIGLLAGFTGTDKQT